MATPAAQQPLATVTIIPGGPQTAKYAHQTVFKLGIAHIVCGILALVFQIFSIIVESELSIIGTGIWCGTMFIVTGIIGIFSSKKYTYSGHIVAFMVLSIISAVFSAILSSISVPGIILSLMFTYGRKGAAVEAASHILLLIIGVIELTIAIISSVMCCCAVCWCCSNPPPQGSLYFYPAPAEHTNAKVIMPSSNNLIDT